MPKICAYEGCSNKCWGGNYCQLPQHQKLRQDSQYLRRIAKQEAKKKEPKKAIAKFSPKTSKEVSIYNARTPSWKLENPVCFVPGCGLPTKDRHHQIGRGIHINDEQYHIPLCFEHHRICKEDPALAEKLGLILTRTIVRKK